MNETLLRVKVIISEIRPLALLIMIVAVLLLGLAISNFVTALGNPAEPHPATIGQLDIAPEEKAGVLGGNAARLFGLSS